MGMSNRTQVLLRLSLVWMLQVNTEPGTTCVLSWTRVARLQFCRKPTWERKSKLFSLTLDWTILRSLAFRPHWSSIVSGSLFSRNSRKVWLHPWSVSISMWTQTAAGRRIGGRSTEWPLSATGPTAQQSWHGKVLKQVATTGTPHGLTEKLRSEIVQPLLMDILFWCWKTMCWYIWGFLLVLGNYSIILGNPLPIFGASLKQAQNSFST